MGSWEVGLVLGLQVCGKVPKIYPVINPCYQETIFQLKACRKASKTDDSWSQKIDTEAF